MFRHKYSEKDTGNFSLSTAVRAWRAVRQLPPGWLRARRAGHTRGGHAFVGWDRDRCKDGPTRKPVEGPLGPEGATTPGGLNATGNGRGVAMNPTAPHLHRSHISTLAIASSPCLGLGPDTGLGRGSRRRMRSGCPRAGLCPGVTVRTRPARPGGGDRGRVLPTRGGGRVPSRGPWPGTVAWG